MIRLLTALALTALGVLGWEGLTGAEVPGWLVVLVYLLTYAALNLLQRKQPNDTNKEPAAVPISGPVGALGVTGLTVVWTLTNTLALLNPWQLAQIIRQVRGNREAGARVPDASPETLATTVLYSPPFEGEWLAINGGLTREDSHSWDIVAQRYAHDFVMADLNHVRHINSGTRLEHYHCYDKPVLAAADGVVIATESRISDAPLVGFGFCDFLARSFIGNYVVIQHAENEFALYAHLVRDSVMVKPGAKVVRGQVIGRCGHTGHSSEPHLHFHVQDSADLFSGVGKPIRFGPAVIDGEEAAQGFLKGGMRIARPAQPNSEVN